MREYLAAHLVRDNAAIEEVKARQVGDVLHIKVFSPHLEAPDAELDGPLEIASEKFKGDIDHRDIGNALNQAANIGQLLDILEKRVHIVYFLNLTKLNVDSLWPKGSSLTTRCVVDATQLNPDEERR